MGSWEAHFGHIDILGQNHDPEYTSFRYCTNMFGGTGRDIDSNQREEGCFCSTGKNGPVTISRR